MRRCGFLVALLVFGLAGCATTRPASAYRRPQMSPEELARYYDYPHAPVSPTVRDKETKPRWTRQIIEFELAVPGDMDRTAIERARQRAATAGKRRARDVSLEYMVRFDYYRPNSPGRHPLVVVSPILGGNTLFADDFCEYFASHGFCAVLVHRKRASVRPEEGLQKVEDDLRKSVLRIRQALDWALQQSEVDTNKVASFGISYGAIVNAMAAGAEPRISYHIFALGGGDLPKIIMNTTEPLIRGQVASVSRARGWTKEQLAAELERTLKSDPLNSAPLLKRENVLMVVAQFDAIVGTQYENLLWRRLGCPERIVVPLGHTTTVLALPFVKGEALQFLRVKFGWKPDPADLIPDYQFYSSKRY